jgi:hypothetical protein
MPDLKDTPAAGSVRGPAAFPDPADGELVNQEPASPDGEETEEQLVSRAQGALSRCNWVVGECAARWTKRYARGRTDADFGQLVGLSADQIYQRRRVWETFGDVCASYPQLKWSHFYVAVNWEDAPEVLQWATEQQATVAEMKAWRRALRGEDLTEAEEAPPDPFAGDPAASLSLSESVAVRQPGGGVGGNSAGERTAKDQNAERVETAYAPYRKDAASPAGRTDGGDGRGNTAELSPEQLLKRMTRALERIVSAMAPDRLDELAELPGAAREPFLEALSELNSRAERLGS